MDMGVNVEIMVNCIVWKVALKLIKSDVDAMVGNCANSVGMVVPRENDYDTEHDTRLKCYEQIASLLTIGDDRVEFSESVRFFSEKYVEAARKRVVSRIVGLAFPVAAEDKAESDCQHNVPLIRPVPPRPKNW